MPSNSVGEDELGKRIAAAEAALDARADLAKYRDPKRDNRRMLFALELHTKTTDIHGIATDALVDGYEDKSIDLLYVDQETGVAYLMQGYESQSKRTVPYEKAKELHMAVNWALASGDTPVPAQIASAVAELHRALASGRVKSFEIWLVHNLREGALHEEELSQACAAAEDILRSKWTRDDGTAIAVVARQVGSHTLASWYEASHTPILVSDSHEVPIVDCYIEETQAEDQSETWRCVVTSVDAEWLRQLAWTHGEQLFSANVRSYMGKRTEINQGIQSTISDQPDRLLVYHNGITALVNSFELERPTDDRPPRLVVNGISIVNGAQTVGSIKRLGDPKKTTKGTEPQPKIGGRLPIRFIECPNREILLEIIRCNNLQNPTEPTDFRSNDETQRRLVAEFRALDIPYDGARRGHLEDGKLARPTGTISAKTVGRILAAFHIDPALGYFDHRSIWEQDRWYAQVFPDRITAAHVLFCYSLYEAIEEERRRCAKSASETGSADDAEIHAYFRNVGSVWLLLSAIGRTMETILGPSRFHSDRFALCFRPELSLSEAVAAWNGMLGPLVAFAAESLGEVFAEQQGLRVAELVDRRIDDFRRVVSGKRRPGKSLAQDCDEFAALVSA